MTPSQYRAGGTNEEIRFAVGETSLGAILVASSKKGVAAILLGNDPDELVRELQDRFPNARLIGADRSYETLVARVVGFIEAPRLGLDLPFDIRGTAFQRRVWRALREVPIGETVSYSEIAQRIGSPNAIRAVAGACAANPPRGRHTVSPRGAERRLTLGLCVGRRAQAGPPYTGSGSQRPLMLRPPTGSYASLLACFRRRVWDALRTIAQLARRERSGPKSLRAISSGLRGEPHRIGHPLSSRHGQQ